MTKRLTQESVEQFFAKQGCELLDQYKTKSKPVKFRCSCGAISTISLSSLRRGSRCMECRGKKKLTHEEVSKTLLNEGYKLVSKYEQAFNPIDVICPHDHKYQTYWNNFQQGRRCPKCAKIETSERLTLTFEQVKSEFEKQDCVLLSKEYKGNRFKLKFICSCGEIAYMTYANFSQGHKCKKCGILKGENHPNWNPDREDQNSIRSRCFSLLRYSLKSLGRAKNGKSYKILGYTAKDLYEHVTNHPDWNNTKDEKWHLDHYFPIKAFCDYGIQDLSLINSLDNLRPMIGRENLKKGAKYNKEEFERWLSVKGFS